MSLPGTTNTTLMRLSVTALLLLAPGVGASPTPPAAAPAGPAGLALLDDAEAGDFAALQDALPTIADPGLAELARARLAASRLETAAARHALARYRALPGRRPGADARAWSIAADVAFADGDYARATEATRQWLSLLADDDPERAEVAQYHGIAALLADTPAQAVLSREPRAIDTSRDRAGLLRARVAVNGAAQQAVLDTGANLSVLSASAAKTLGVELLEGAASVASGSREQVATRLGIAERVEIAGVVLSNVVFLVLDDAQLEMPLPGGYRIDAIIGFPVLRAIGRMRLGADGTFLPLPARGSGAASPDNLRVVGSDLFVGLAVNGIATALHLDTGAPASQLSTRFAQQHPGVLAGLERRERHSASAGGVTSRQVALWPRVRVTIADAAMVLPQLAVAVDDSAHTRTRTFGVLGLDVIGAFDAYVLDFDAMSFEVEDQMAARPREDGDNQARESGSI